MHHLLGQAICLTSVPPFTSQRRLASLLPPVASGHLVRGWLVRQWEQRSSHVWAMLWFRHASVCGAELLFITHSCMAHCGNRGADRGACDCGRCACHADRQEAPAGEAQASCCGRRPVEGAAPVLQCLEVDALRAHVWRLIRPVDSCIAELLFSAVDLEASSS